ncbi:hypothetical protein MKW98_027385 [Papaver atlanticum]|uniref:Uncharacterized protein n=1 Tax=Papaver atlanticum TaxID=357466 RepID=A0AAD4XUD2_9MAGN|nr:hypothetical protein MKW98_027385 [Papaver atlanticum]
MEVFGLRREKLFFRVFSSHSSKSQATAARLATTVSANKGSSSDGPKPNDDCVLFEKINKLSKIKNVLKDGSGSGR